MYLNNNLDDLPNWEVIYSSFKDLYKYLDGKEIIINEVFLTGSAEIHNIIYRTAIYNIIKVLESFNFDGLINAVNEAERYNRSGSYIKMSYWHYGLNWSIIYKIFSYSFEGEGANYLEPTDSLSNNLLDQDNTLKILEILISYPEIRTSIIDNYWKLEITGMTYPLDNFDTKYPKREEELFKFIYINKMIQIEDCALECFITTIQEDNYSLFKWLLENRERTWIDNPKFEKIYESLKDKTNHCYKDRDYVEYDKLLKMYKEN